MSDSLAMSDRDEPPRDPTRRLFFALWPAEVTREDFARATRKAVRACGGRPVPVVSLHVTLTFLGSVPERRIPELSSIARQVGEQSSPVVLTFDCLEHWARPQLMCATSSLSPVQATDLAEALRRQTAARGFSPDLKPFRPHVTVARKVVHPTRSLDMSAVLWPFADFVLVSSFTHPEGPAYSVIESYSLDGGIGRSSSAK
jgi:2'-5' RNA ligase